MAISHPKGSELPEDHPLRPGAPMMIFPVRKAPRMPVVQEPPSIPVSDEELPPSVEPGAKLRDSLEDAGFPAPPPPG
jgi:hypothetical protein